MICLHCWHCIHCWHCSYCVNSFGAKCWVTGWSVWVISLRLLWLWQGKTDQLKCWNHPSGFTKGEVGAKSEMYLTFAPNLRQNRTGIVQLLESSMEEIIWTSNTGNSFPKIKDKYTHSALSKSTDMKYEFLLLIHLTNFDSEIWWGLMEGFKYCLVDLFCKDGEEPT